MSVAAITLHESKPPPPSAAHARQSRRRPSAGPAPHPVAAQSNITRARSMLCGRHAPSHAGQGNTLAASCCRTCRRLCAKYGRPLEVPCGERPRRGRARPMKCASPQPARWTRLSASNRLRSRSSPPDEDRGRPSPRSRRRHRPPRRPPPAPAARPRPPAPGYSPALHGPPTGKHEAGRRATPARPARAESEPTERPAAPLPATATRRSLQPPPRPPAERPRSGGPHARISTGFVCDRGDRGWAWMHT